MSEIVRLPAPLPSLPPLITKHFEALVGKGLLQMRALQVWQGSILFTIKADMSWSNSHQQQVKITNISHLHTSTGGKQTKPS